MPKCPMHRRRRASHSHTQFQIVGTQVPFATAGGRLFFRQQEKRICRSHLLQGKRTRQLIRSTERCHQGARKIPISGFLIAPPHHLLWIRLASRAVRLGSVWSSN
ncbi:hypothetical protein PVAP13_5NG224162 [Panicum virgatum]|uniref:Uncharacterized protein n=1 Tax=Panicum virgatum TaxID=38727 RepID=A0A8T0RS20_PANVG|nr:hypothetical protein PVAP13_5NG224162 [Panicum virgatum]